MIYYKQIQAGRYFLSSVHVVDWFASHLDAPPELLLSRALMQAPQVPLPPGAAAKALPSLGDVPLALAMMGNLQPEASTGYNNEFTQLNLHLLQSFHV